MARHCWMAGRARLHTPVRSSSSRQVMWPGAMLDGRDVWMSLRPRCAGWPAQASFPPSGIAQWWGVGTAVSPLGSASYTTLGGLPVTPGKHKMFLYFLSKAGNSAGPMCEATPAIHLPDLLDVTTLKVYKFTA